MVATLFARRTKLSAIGCGGCNVPVFLPLLVFFVAAAMEEEIEDDTLVGATDDDDDEVAAVLFSVTAHAKSVPMRTDNPTPNPYGTM